VDSVTARVNILPQRASKSGGSSASEASPRARQRRARGGRRESPARVRAYVALGANVGDAPSTLAAAIQALAALPGAELRGVSRLYRTRPVGVTDQPDFHNAAVALDVPPGPDPETGAMALLIALKGIERAFGRRDRERWGPRELDLDLLLFGDHAFRVERAEAAISSDPAKVGPQWLEVPHPRARERLFVLAPLADLAPDLTPPGWDETVESARRTREVVEGAAAAVPLARWDSGWR
jgi:2-amino-4-hydroxy-6-hydroxymethyldihydropteridine diphosphokinase